MTIGRAIRESPLQPVGNGLDRSAKLHQNLRAGVETRPYGLRDKPQFYTIPIREDKVKGICQVNLRFGVALRQKSRRGCPACLTFHIRTVYTGARLREIPRLLPAIVCLHFVFLLYLVFPPVFWLCGFSTRREFLFQFVARRCFPLPSGRPFFSRKTAYRFPAFILRSVLRPF